MRKRALRKRDLYLEKLIAFKDMDVVKVITGIRRCGKSSLLTLMAGHLRDNGIREEQILEINFESMDFYNMSCQELNQYIKENSNPEERMYLFFDEIQRVADWQIAVNSFMVDMDCDIYITGSNAYLLSSELSTYLSGRYVEIRMYPLSFREFLDFHGFVLTERRSPLAGNSLYVSDGKGEIYGLREFFDAYVKFGGMPALADVGFDQEKISVMLDGVYSAVVVRDILERERRKGQRAITDPILLRKIILFLADNIGSNVSATSIGGTLADEGLLERRGGKGRPATQTIQAYIDCLTEAHIFYNIKRYDIKGKSYLRTLGKYYIADTGLRNYLLGYRDGDTGHLLENIIYFELLRRGYEVAIGKAGQKEVDFIAVKTDEKKYIQVTESMLAPETRARELAPLKSIRDNYEKIVITMEPGFTAEEEGIKIIKALDFLLE